MQQNVHFHETFKGKFWGNGVWFSLFIGKCHPANCYKGVDITLVYSGYDMV